jgi:large subunit ribosomal protein L25
MDLELTVEPRTVTGKQTKLLRQAGTVPAVIFGKGSESVPVQVDVKRFESLYHAAGRTGIVKLTVSGGRTTSGMIKSVQRHPLTGRAIHVDFFLVDLKAEMQADIPLTINGEAPAIEQLGGSLFSALDHVKVRALPADLPHEIAVDVSGLTDFEASIHVRDLQVDTDKVQILNDPDDLVARVNPPRAAEEVAVVEGEGEAEGAEPTAESTESESGSDSGSGAEDEG